MGADLTGGTPGLHGFPGTLTSFVGRSEAVRELAGLLETSRVWLGQRQVLIVIDNCAPPAVA